MTMLSFELPCVEAGSDLLTEAVVEKLLTHAYGVGEANRAAQLPLELASSLYGPVLQYGPAVEQIEAFVAAMMDADEDHPVWELFKVLYIVIFHPKNGDMTEILTAPNYYLGSWARNNDLNVLELGFRAATDILDFGWGHHVLGVQTVMWYLTGQYLFDAEAQESLAPAVRSVNKILISLNLEPLVGNLAEVNA